MTFITYIDIFYENITVVQNLAADGTHNGFPLSIGETHSSLK
jgi:hypothetical protein